MHFYSIGYGELLQLPISVFWVMARNIDRIRAESDQRKFRVHAHVMAGKPEKLMAQLNREKGQIVDIEEVGNGTLDRAGLSMIRAQMARARG